MKKPDLDSMTERELLQYAADKNAEAAKHLRRAIWACGVVLVGLILQLVAVFLR